MRAFITAIGILTLAQWIFVGLLYGFIEFQDKNTPETMAKLHDLPVVGGYFPKVRMISQEEKDREYGDELRIRRIEAQRFYQLPAAWNEQEFLDLTNELHAKGAELTKRERELQQRMIEVESMIGEIEKRETNLVKEQQQLEERAGEILLERQELDVAKKGVERQIDQVEATSFKTLSKAYGSMEPAAAAERLVSVPSGETRDDALRDAAKILLFMDSEQVASILSSMDITDSNEVTERMKTLTKPR